jgi:hypothetical protein
MYSAQLGRSNRLGSPFDRSSSAPGELSQPLGYECINMLIVIIVIMMMIEVVPRAGVEPATCWLRISCSGRLSYLGKVNWRVR